MSKVLKRQAPKREVHFLIQNPVKRIEYEGEEKEHEEEWSHASERDREWMKLEKKGGEISQRVGALKSKLKTSSLSLSLSSNSIIPPLDDSSANVSISESSSSRDLSQTSPSIPSSFIQFHESERQRKLQEFNLTTYLSEAFFQRLFKGKELYSIQVLNYPYPHSSTHSSSTQLSHTGTGSSNSKLFIPEGKIKKLENLHHLPSLHTLQLPYHSISSLSGLQILSRTLKVLHLSYNSLNSLQFLSSLIHLEECDLSHNQIVDLPSKNKLKLLKNLHTLKLHNNQLKDLESLTLSLKSLFSLTNLTLYQNPSSLLPFYQSYIIFHLPSLHILDSQSISVNDRLEAKTRWEHSEINNLQEELELKILEWQVVCKDYNLLKKQQDTWIDEKTEIENEKQMSINKYEEIKKDYEEYQKQYEKLSQDYMKILNEKQEIEKERMNIKTMDDANENVSGNGNSHAIHEHQRRTTISGSIRRSISREDEEKDENQGKEENEEERSSLPSSAAVFPSAIQSIHSDIRNFTVQSSRHLSSVIVSRSNYEIYSALEIYIQEYYIEIQNQLKSLSQSRESIWKSLRDLEASREYVVKKKLERETLKKERENKKEIYLKQVDRLQLQIQGLDRHRAELEEQKRKEEEEENGQEEDEIYDHIRMELYDELQKCERELENLMDEEATQKDQQKRLSREEDERDDEEKDEEELRFEEERMVEMQKMQEEDARLSREEIEFHEFSSFLSCKLSSLKSEKEKVEAEWKKLMKEYEGQEAERKGRLLIDNEMNKLNRYTTPNEQEIHKEIWKMMIDQQWQLEKQSLLTKHKISLAKANEKPEAEMKEKMEEEKRMKLENALKDSERRAEEYRTLYVQSNTECAHLRARYEEMTAILIRDQIHEKEKVGEMLRQNELHSLPESVQVEIEEKSMKLMDKERRKLETAMRLVQANRPLNEDVDKAKQPKLEQKLLLLQDRLQEMEKDLLSSQMHEEELEKQLVVDQKSRLHAEQSAYQFSQDLDQLKRQYEEEKKRMVFETEEWIKKYEITKNQYRILEHEMKKCMQDKSQLEETLQKQQLSKQKEKKVEFKEIHQKYQKDEAEDEEVLDEERMIERWRSFLKENENPQTPHTSKVNTHHSPNQTEENRKLSFLSPDPGSKTVAPYALQDPRYGEPSPMQGAVGVGGGRISDIKHSSPQSTLSAKAAEGSQAPAVGTSFLSSLEGRITDLEKRDENWVNQCRFLEEQNRQLYHQNHLLESQMKNEEGERKRLLEVMESEIEKRIQRKQDMQKWIKHLKDRKKKIEMLVQKENKQKPTQKDENHTQQTDSDTDTSTSSNEERRETKLEEVTKLTRKRPSRKELSLQKNIIHPNPITPRSIMKRTHLTVPK